jgi:protein-S-isoprenylcysteine O-methyltransferase Ste14
MWRHPLLKAVLLIYIGWGGWIKTSLVRDDTGAGACEVLLVNDVALLP